MLTVHSLYSTTKILSPAWNWVSTLITLIRFSLSRMCTTFHLILSLICCPLLVSTFWGLTTDLVPFTLSNTGYNSWLSRPPAPRDISYRWANCGTEAQRRILLPKVMTSQEVEQRLEFISAWHLGNVIKAGYSSWNSNYFPMLPPIKPLASWTKREGNGCFGRDRVTEWVKLLTTNPNLRLLWQ